MELNPYAKYLGDRDPIAVLESTAARLFRVVDRLPEEELQLRPPSGKWSGREIVAHLADCEIAFAFRLKQTLAEDHPVMQPFDQDRWAARYANFDMSNALRLFSALRDWNLLLFDELTPEQWQRPTTHPERGTMTLRTIAETMAGHDLNHLAQFERLARPAAIP
ncbi:MAG: DinB family protein [Acidobacteriota bacterium]|nr:DinB family protein [Acidobacteriota bacterium]